MPFITPNRVRDEDQVSDDETRLSDIDQVRNNFRYALDQFKLAHSEIDGSHSAITASDALSLLSTASTLAATAGQTSATSMYESAALDVGEGTTSIPVGIAGGVPTGISPGRTEWLLTLRTAGPDSSHLDNYRRRLVTGTSTTVTNQATYTIDPLGASGDQNENEFPDFAVNTTRYPVCANHYDMAYRSAEIMLEALDYQHDASGQPDFGIANVTGAQYHALGIVTIGGSVGNFRTSTLLAHGGGYYAAALGGVSITVDAATIGLLAGYDDTSVYAVRWTIAIGGGLDNIFGAAVTIPLTTPATTPAVYDDALTDTFAKAQGYPHEPSEWQQQLDNAEYLRALFIAEHEEDGTHRVPLQDFTGYTVVKTAWAVTADSTIGNITETLIESEPGDVVYLVGLVGAAGSGIVTATISRDGVDSYLVLRRATTGSTNSFTATIWRVSRV